ncbi:hypothetical protein WJX82_004915 [Trebouxia sp. C0006]
MSLADVSGSELSGPSSELFRSSVKLDDLPGVPHSGILPRLVLRTVSWHASIGRVTNPKGPLSLKAFARGDISQPLAFPLGFLQYSVQMWCPVEGWGDVYSEVSVGLSMGVQEWNRCARGVVSM